jgi:hypothetical protein
MVFDTRMNNGIEISLRITYKPRAKDTLESGLNRRVRFRSRGPVGYGPTMWVESRKGGDILHSKQGMSKDSLSAMSAIMSVPRTGNEEKHFPAH